MPLKNMVVYTGATITVADGSPLTFINNGQSIPGGLQLVVKEDTDYQTKRILTVKYRPSSIDAKTGKWGKNKKSMTFVSPMVLADGQVVFNTIRLERELHPSVTAGAARDMNKLAMQFMQDPDTSGFWDDGSMD